MISDGHHTPQRRTGWPRGTMRGTSPHDKTGPPNYGSVRRPRAGGPGPVLLGVALVAALAVAGFWYATRPQPQPAPAPTVSVTS